jgi:hypothetical protein
MEAVANWIVDNSKTTPETGLPGAVTAYHDVSSVIDKLDQHVQGQGDQLIATAREEAVNPPGPDTAAKLTEGAQYATGIFDMLETLRSSYRGIRGWRARSEAKKQGELGEAEERNLGRSIKSAAGSLTIGFLNSAKFVGGLIDKLGGGIIGAIAGTASYIRSLRQMGEAEKAYLALRGIKVSNKHPDPQEAVRTARKKKGRKFGRKLASALTSGLGASLSIGQVVALATGGAAAAAALAVTPVGLAVGGVALAISLGLAGYAIWRKIHKRRLGKRKVEQRNRVADYLHAVLAREIGSHYERKIARKVVLALGLALEECQGPAGRDNIHTIANSPLHCVI